MRNSPPLRIQTVVTTRWPACLRRIQLLPVGLEEAFLFKPAQDRIRGSSRQPCCAYDAEAVDLISWRIQEHLEYELGFVRASTSHGAEPSINSE
jgi:hypothetical protein